VPCGGTGLGAAYHTSFSSLFFLVLTSAASFTSSMSQLYNDRGALVDPTISLYRTRIDSDSHKREAIAACSLLGSEEGSVLNLSRHDAVTVKFPHSTYFEPHFGMEEKYWNFGGFKSYRNFF
jgi:hypothetical protein